MRQFITAFFGARALFRIGVDRRRCFAHLPKRCPTGCRISFYCPLPTAPCPLPPLPALLRFLTFYTFLLTLLYGLISYKTPWWQLSFLMGMILLAGIGAAAVFRFMPNWPLKVLATVVLAAGAGHLGWQAYQLNFNPRYIADPLNPYVYAHTPMPLPKLAARLDRLGEQPLKAATCGCKWS